MTWPASNVVRTNADSTLDNPSLFRVNVLDLIDKFNEMRAHVSAFMAALLSAADAPSARSALGMVIGTHVPSPIGGGASGTWGISITGNAATASNGGVTSFNGGTGAVTLTTANVLSLMAGTAVGSVGSYAFMIRGVTPVALGPGTNVAGSELRYSDGTNLPGVTPTGTWQLMGHLHSVVGNYASLWLRVL